ncbi:expressed unknown protein [Seminavis robusta]|uniref:non-specific serine/threonine protein kinase n=1 Tax=Seminavis robusta TaxID=568900 RepID=A0A9N8EJK6_9STRA|nr:expressed unknown protein [Seminavis robusta]|eukprot:Sro1061_g236860.2  (1322) ;mRNA; r:25810-29775
MPAAVGRITRGTGGPQAIKKKVGRIRSHKFRAQDFVRKRQNESLTDHYTIGKLLGEGQFGEVFIGTVQKSNGGKGDNRAIKRIQKVLMTEEDHEEVFNEFTLLKQMDHPSIAKMFEFFEDAENFWFVQELCSGGELLDELERTETFSEASAALIIKQVLSSVHYCHSQKQVVHRDLKLENILLEEGTQNVGSNSASYNPMIVKVIDFGLATTFTEDQVLTAPVGSMHYVAPEVLEQEYNYKCDVWSCGVIAYILLCGFAPFDALNDRDMRELIMMGHVSFADPIWQNDVSQDAKDFVSYLLTYEPDKRPDAGQALQHKWIQNLSKVHAEEFKATKSGTDAAVRLLSNCRSFESASKLKQATCAFMTSQLVLSGDDDDENDNNKNCDETAADHQSIAMMIGEIFRAIDLDADGRISHEELRVGFLDFLGGDDLTVEEVDDIFSRMDMSATGYLDYSEFVVASMGLHDLEQGNHRALLKQAFERLLDKDGSGFISMEKLRKEMAPFYGEDVEEDVIQKIIDQADADQDGQVSWDDFQAMMSKTADFVPPENATPLSRHKELPQDGKKQLEEPTTKADADDIVKEDAKEDTKAETNVTPTETAAAQTEAPVEAEKTPPSPGRRVNRNSAAGPKARLISAVFEKNLEKNREMGFDKFTYIRKQSSRGGPKRTLPRTRRVNFEELTKKANTQVNFDARAARDGRSKEIEQLKSTPGRARERRATIATLFQQEKEEQRNRRESRMLELETIKTQSHANDRQQVRSSFQETNARKAQEKRSEELEKLRSSVNVDDSAKKRLFEMWNPPKTSCPSAGQQRASQVQVMKDLKRFKQMFDQAAQEGTLKEKFARQRPSLQAGAMPPRASRGWTKRLSGKSYQESQEDMKNSSHHSRRGLGRATSHAILFDIDDIEDRLVDMQPSAKDERSARMIEPLRRLNSFDSIQEQDEMDERLGGMIGEEVSRVATEQSVDKEADSGNEDSTTPKNQKEVNKAKPRHNVKASSWEDQQNSLVSQTQEKREARFQELNQLMKRKSGKANIARELFEATIQANEKAASKTRSIKPEEECRRAGRRNSLAPTIGKQVSPVATPKQARRSSMGASTISVSSVAADEPKRDSINLKELGKNEADIHMPSKDLPDVEDTVRRGSKSTSHPDNPDSNSISDLGYEETVHRGSKSASRPDNPDANSISHLGYEETEKNQGSMAGLSYEGNDSVSERNGDSVASIGMGGSMMELCLSPSPTSPAGFGRRRNTYKKIKTPKNVPRFGTPTTPKGQKPSRARANRRASATATMTAPVGTDVTEAQMKFLKIANNRAMKAKAKDDAANAQ